MGVRLKAQLFASLLLMTLPLAALPVEPDPQHWLQRMVEAGETESFSGDLVYGQGAELQALRIVRLRDGDARHERILTLSGPAREVLREDRQVTHILEDARLVMLDRGDPRTRLSDLTPRQIRELSSWYRLALDGTSRIAERSTERLQLVPRDGYRHGYRLWIDRETGLLLRSQMRDANDQILEQFMFVSIRFDAFDPAQVNPSINHEGFQHHAMEAVVPPQGQGDWEATDLPPGFRLLDDGWRPSSNGGGPVRHLLYGDGAASVSVYIADDVGKPFHGHSSQGSMQVAGKLLDGYQLTVVGDVPARTVMRVMDGLEYRE